MAGIVLMLRGASGKDVVAGVEEKLAVARRSLPEDLSIVPFYDRTELVETALGTVKSALAQGALLILANIPLALVGGVIGLKLSGLYLSVSALVGFIALFGIAVLNGLVMIEFFLNLEAEGKSRRQAILEGAELRLRQVMMTAATTALGLAPLVWATGVGSEVQRPLAVVVVSGVITSTLLTLLVLPVLYQWFGGRGEGADEACAEAFPAPPPAARERFRRPAAMAQ